MSERKETEYIDVYTVAGVIEIDLTACVENGIVDLESGEGTTGEAIVAIKNAINGDDALLKSDGWPILIVGKPTAFGYRREEAANA